MFAKRIGGLALGLATVALPLTALATPASASQHDDRHDDDSPSISIKDVSYRHGDFKVKVKYRCYTDQNDDHKGHRRGDKGKDDKVEDGTIEVTLWQRHAKYSGDEDVACDGDWDYTTIVLDQHDGHLDKGKAWVKAEITDPQDETDSDRAEVYVKKHDHH